VSAITNLYDAVKETTGILPNVTPINADANGTAVDMKGFRSCLFVIAIGAADAGDTLSGTNKIGLELEDSDDNSTFANVTDAALVDGNVEDMTGGLFYEVVSDATASKNILISYKGTRRYVRVVLNFAGTHATGTPINIVGLATGSAHVPI